jgi:quinoprotein relay system zinc metallohydrolase 2
MFEAVILICAVATGGPCRPALLPGYEAPEAAACARALADRPPTLPVAGRDERLEGSPHCTPRGPVLDFEEVAPGLFVHAGLVEEPSATNAGDVSNLAFVVGDETVALIDTGSTRAIGEAAWRAIRDRTTLPLGHVILTHMHPDHVLGASAFLGTGARIVGHAGLPRALADRAESYLDSFGREIGVPAFLGSTVALPDLLVEDRLTLDLGGRVLELEAWPMAHSPTDLTVTDRTAGVLIAGDLVFDRHAPALDGSLRGWQTALADLMARDLPGGVVPGHGAALIPWPEGGRPQARYLDRLAEDLTAAIAEGRRMGEVIESAAADEAPQWELFPLHNPRNATLGFAELEWE